MKKAFKDKPKFMDREIPKQYFYITGAILIFIALFLLVSPVSSFIQSQLNTSVTEENLTFTGDQNITRYVSIFRNSTVNTAILNVSGHSIPVVNWVKSGFNDNKSSFLDQGFDYQVNISNVYASYTPGVSSYGSPTIYNGLVYSCTTGGLNVLDANNISDIIGTSNLATDCRGTPVIYNDFLYVVTNLGEVYQLNLSNVSQSFSSIDLSTGSQHAGSPIVFNNSLYFGSSSSAFFQFNASDLSQKLSNYSIYTGYYTSMAYDEGSIYVVGSGKANVIYQFDANNVSNLISNTTVKPQTIYSPVVDDNYVYVASEDTLFKLNKSNLNQHFENFTALNDLGGIAIDESYVYIGSGDDNFYQLNKSNISQEIYTYNVGDDIRGNPIIANNYIYVTVTGDSIFQFEKGNVSNLIDSKLLDLGGGVMLGQPIYYDGFIYVKKSTLLGSVLYQLGVNASIENPWLEVGTPDGNYEWNFSGSYLGNENSEDFTTEINNYINTCELLDNYCNVPLKYHLDSPGILKILNLDIDYDSVPYINLITPLNNTFSSITKNFSCNATDVVGVDNMTLLVTNSSGSQYVANLTSTGGTTFEQASFMTTFTYSDTFTWKCIANNNESRLGESPTSYTINVDVDNPVITLNYPGNETWTNQTTNLAFNCTAENDNPGSLFFYNNFISSWGQDSVLPIYTSGVEYNFTRALTDGYYLWTCAANETTNATLTFSQNGNRTFGVDTVDPNITINTVTTAAGSQTFSFKTNATDLNVDHCAYSIYSSTGGFDGLNTLITYACDNVTNGTASPTVTAFGTYELQTWVFDKAQNGQYANITVTVSASAPSTGQAGGGGGDIIVSNISGEFNINQIVKLLIFAPWSGYEKTDEVETTSNVALTSCELEFDTENERFFCDINGDEFSITTFFTETLSDENTNELIYTVEDVVSVITTDSERLQLPIVYTVYNFHYYIPLNIGNQDADKTFAPILFYDEDGNISGLEVWTIVGGVLIIFGILLYFYYQNRRFNKQVQQALRFDAIRRLNK